MSTMQKMVVKNLIILFTIFTILFLVSLLIKYPNYIFCKNHFPNELLTCVFSERYRVVK